TEHEALGRVLSWNFHELDWPQIHHSASKGTTQTRFRPAVVKNALCGLVLRARFVGGKYIVNDVINSALADDTKHRPDTMRRILKTVANSGWIKKIFCARNAAPSEGVKRGGGRGSTWSIPKLGSEIFNPIPEYTLAFLRSISLLPLTPMEMAVMRVIAFYALPDGSCSMSCRMIAQRTEINERTLRAKIIPALIEKRRLER